MESKYVPPHMRNKKVTELAPVPEQTMSKEEEFPIFVEPKQVRVFGSTNGKTFASLASSWGKDAEEQKLQEAVKKQENEALEMIRRRRIAPLPQFHNIRRFVEPEDEEQVEEKPKAPVDPDEEGWTEVKPKKKLRRPKTFEERMARPSTPDQNEPDETVWNTADDDDTYWK